MSKKRRLRVGLYVNDSKATTLRFVRCLQEWGMAYVSVWRDDLASLAPGDVDVLLLHGGWYGIDRTPPQDQHDKIQTPAQRRVGKTVCEYVRAGGGIVGVCCGAFNIVWLDLIEADVSRAAGVGPHALEAVDATHPITRRVLQRAQGRADRKWLPTPVIRFNGPMFFPKHQRTMIFSYDWEHRLGAVLADQYGAGRAVAISPHPERTESDYDGAHTADTLTEKLMPAARILQNSLLWAAGRPVPKQERRAL